MKKYQHLACSCLTNLIIRKQSNKYIKKIEVVRIQSFFFTWNRNFAPEKILANAKSS